MFRHFCIRRKKRAKRDIIGPRFPRFHRQMAAGMASHANLRLASQGSSGIGDQTITLAQMHP
ncbi:MAG: hypothetical protein RLY97_71, partial [Pseudomonadota bacterium]